MVARVTDEQRQLVETNQGCIPLEGGGGQYVLMRWDVYRQLLGIGSDHELEESLAAIRRGWADVQAGRTRPIRDMLDDLGRKHETPD